jgi:hypothetical protein
LMIYTSRIKMNRKYNNNVLRLFNIGIQSNLIPIWSFSQQLIG